MMLRSSHYVVAGSIGLSRRHMRPYHKVMDTGPGFNVIRSSALPDGWQDKLISDCQMPNLSDSTRKPLSLRGAVQLRVRFKNSIFSVTFRLAVDFILGTCFKNVKAIECMAGKIVFQHNNTKVSILDSRTGEPIKSKPLSKEDSS